MRCTIARLLLASALLLMGCSGDSGSGEILEITENGIFDVSGYSQVVVSVESEDQTAGEGNAEPAVSDIEFDLVRAHFKYFSMEVPDLMVKDYTEQELTEDSMQTLMIKGADDNDVCMLSIHSMEMHGTISLEDFSDGPQSDIDGIVMAIKHEHVNEQRNVKVNFVGDNVLHTVTLTYPVARDDVYGDYAEQFYRTIQMN